jgi:3-oxoacyl-[acyl-carrier-protein] synthase-3
MTAIGIVGVGTYLPAFIRGNDSWPADVVKRWTVVRREPPPAGLLSESARQIASALAAQGNDPFQGAVERHVIADDMTTLDMEVLASRDAIERSRIDAATIDLVLVHSVPPDRLLTNYAAVLHHRLGLSPACFAMQCEAAAYTFLMQLELAKAMIATGRARYALLVQSSAATRLVEPDDVVSPYFGDAASAVVVGPVAGRGIIGAVHYVDGRFPDTLVASVPNGRWYDIGRPVIWLGDPPGMTSVLLQSVDLCERSVAAVLADTRCEAAAIDFFCIHQGTPWLRRLAQERSGLAHAASIDTFSKTGYVFSAIIPLGLAMAEQQGLLKKGQLVLLFGGGTGMTYGATVIEWEPG